jgi:hypothetical protein
MPLIACSQCGVEFEDEILCCPHCGAAQIPQLSKAELRVARMKASQGPMATIYLGMVMGLAIGAIIFTIAALMGAASFQLGLGILMLGMTGSAAGFLIHRFFLTNRR